MALSCHCGDYGGHRRDCGYYEAPKCGAVYNGPEGYMTCVLPIEYHPKQTHPDGTSEPIHQSRDGFHFIVPKEREQMPKASHQLREMEHISPEDYDDYLRVIDGALAVHDDRERKRKGLWKNYPPQDQLRQCKIKVERCLHLLEQDPDMDADTVAEIVAEGHDIINYAIFAVRKAQR
jgi:hypothetical protein